MLERAVGLVVLVPGDVGLRVAGDDRAVALDEGLHVPTMTVVVEQRVSDAEPDAEPSRFVEQRLRRLVGHRALVPVVGFGDVVDEPAREERRQRQLRVDDEFDTVLRCLMQQRDHPRNHLVAAVVALNRPELRGCDGENS